MVEELRSGPSRWRGGVDRHLPRGHAKAQSACVQPRAASSRDGQWKKNDAAKRWRNGSVPPPGGDDAAPMKPTPKCREKVATYRRLAALLLGPANSTLDAEPRVVEYMTSSHGRSGPVCARSPRSCSWSRTHCTRTRACGRRDPSAGRDSAAHCTSAARCRRRRSRRCSASIPRPRAATSRVSSGPVSSRARRARTTDVRRTCASPHAAGALRSPWAPARARPSASLLDKVPRAERARVIEALESVAKIVDAAQSE